MAGNVPPVMENPAPLIVAELMVTAPVPEEVRVSASVDVVFRFTFPNARAPLLTVNWGVVPVPLRDTVAVVPLDELLEMLSVPLADPATVGAKLT